MKTQRISLDGGDVDFDAARKAADRIAGNRLAEPLLVAWHDGAAGKGHPDVHECTGRPGWRVYAESRGGKLTIDVNSGQYLFIYAETALKSS